MDNATAARNNEVEMDPKTEVRCSHCNAVYSVDALDPEMRCPKCDHTGWTPVQANTGERQQIPSGDPQVDAH